MCSWGGTMGRGVLQGLGLRKVGQTSGSAPGPPSTVPGLSEGGGPGCTPGRGPPHLCSVDRFRAISTSMSSLL